MEQSFSFDIDVDQVGRLAMLKNTLENYINNYNPEMTLYTDTHLTNSSLINLKINYEPKNIFTELEENNNTESVDFIPVRIKHEKTNKSYMDQIKVYLKEFKLPISSDLCNEVTMDNCIICYDTLNTPKLGNILKIRPCNHYFHDNCLENWVYEKWNEFENKKVTYQCPLCRQEF